MQRVQADNAKRSILLEAEPLKTEPLKSEPGGSTVKAESEETVTAAGGAGAEVGGEEDDPVLTVKGVGKRLSEITEEDQANMTPEEYEVFNSCFCFIASVAYIGCVCLQAFCQYL